MTSSSRIEPLPGTAIFITWTHHRRTSSISRELGLPLLELITRKRHIRRYILLSWQTLAFLMTYRPRVVLAQNPSIVLALLLIGARTFLRFRLIVDAHNEAVRPFLVTCGPCKWLSRYLLRHADITVVTNSELAADVSKSGGNALVLHDPLPYPPIDVRVPPVSAQHIVVISTFAPDEPLAAIFKAADHFNEITFYVTGNTQRLTRHLRAQGPRNVTFTGYLDDESYWRLIQSSCGVIDLTTMPDCLVCGAYEALAARVPMLLSDNPATRRVFGRVAVLTTPDVESIRRGISTLTSPRAPQPNDDDIRRFREQWARASAPLTQTIANFLALGKQEQ